jgi:phosphate transport system substrate-binding protein
LVTINDGSYAPLSRPIFIYINAASLDDPAVTKFVEFYLEQAATLAEEVGYVALPAEAYRKGAERVAQRVVGTAYGENASITNLIVE